MQYSSVLVLLSFVLSATALVTPHFPHHRQLAARVGPSLKRHHSGKKCRPRPTTAAPDTDTQTQPNEQNDTATTPPAAPTPTPTPTPPADVPPSPSPVDPSPPASPTPPSSPPPSGGVSADVSAFFVGTQSGDGTFYEPGSGACGGFNSESDNIAAVSHSLFDVYPGYNGVNPNTNPICNRPMIVSYGGRSVQVKVVDRCEGCAMTDVDLSPAAFNQIADAGLGRVTVNWHWA